MPYKHTHRRSHQKRHLRSTIKCCITKDGNTTRDEYYQYEEWYEA